MRKISSVVPLFEKTMTRLPVWTAPRSPCAASAALRKKAGVPRLEKVAATLAATRPDLPMPRQTIGPLLPGDLGHDRADLTAVGGKEALDRRLLLEQDVAEPVVGPGGRRGGGVRAERDDAAGGAAHWTSSG